MFGIIHKIFKEVLNYGKRTFSSLVLAIFMSGCSMGIVYAQEHSQSNKDMEKAIWDYKHENYEEAYIRLKVLRTEYPKSSMVAYYLGITCKKLANYSEARPHLEAAVVLLPKIKNALPELIDLLYKEGDIEGAKKWIVVAERESVSPAQIAFLKGLVLLKEGKDIDGAIEEFKKAKAIDGSISATADYYIGLAYVKAEKMSEAKGIFKEIITRSANTSLAAYADQYVEAISRKEEASRPFRGNVGYAVQYDDNVVLQPDNNSLAIDVDNKGDWRQVCTANGEYNWKPRDDFATKLGYSMYYGKQSDLGFYDMTNQVFLAQPSFYMERAAITFPVDYNYVTVNDKGYLSAVDIANLDNFMLGKNNMAQVGFMYRNKDYLWAPAGPGENRDSNEYIGHGAWFWFFAKNNGFTQIRYALNYDDTVENNWRYVGNRVSFSFMAPVVKKVKIGGTLDYFVQHFTDQNVIFKKRRFDCIFTASSILSIELFKNAELQLSYTYVDDVSNIQLYKYTRDVYSLGVKYSF